MDIPEIPGKCDPEFDDALNSLVRSASSIRELLLMSLTSDTDMKALMLRHADLVTNCDKVIDAWREHLGIND